MSLTYNLKFKRKLEKKQELKKLIENNDNKFFLISGLLSYNNGYINGSFENQMIELEFDEISEVSFDILKKDADSVLLRKSVLNMAHKIINEIYPDEDYYFDLNGDFIFEKRENGITKRNSKSDFYQGLD
ncbi:hypothetical protein [Chryseobacterium sp. SIMBA_038]|uniref:hypothetical protein n=1 Tax=Chryseobacterium sp. SIMBA_038 TaxID=3085780 RepID=UPI00397A40B5